MRLHVLFQGAVPKQAETPDSMQDAFCVNGSFTDNCLRAAISDGVSQSFMQAIWANILTQRFCNSRDVENTNLFEQDVFNAWIESARKEWKEEVQRTLSSKPERIRERALDKLNAAEYAAATFLGLELKKDAGGGFTWKAIIHGDSCLFFVNRDKFQAHPLSRVSHFSNTPDYLASVSGKTQGTPAFLGGETERGDVLLLATDALAKWILQNTEETGQQFSSHEKFRNLTAVSNWDQFYKFINYYRAARSGEVKLDDDDTTLVSLAVDLSPKSRQLPALFRTIEEQTLEDYYYSTLSEREKTLGTTSKTEKEAIVPIVREPEETQGNTEMISDKKTETYSKISIGISVLSFLFALLSLFVASKSLQTIASPTENISVTNGTVEFTFTPGSSLYSNPNGEPIFYFATEYTTAAHFAEDQWILTEFMGWIWLADPKTTAQIVESTLHTVELTRVYAEPTSGNPITVGAISPGNTFFILDSWEDKAGQQWGKVLVSGYFQISQD